MNGGPHAPPPVPAAPRVTVCVGGGGVGKTTVSAALALASARRGQATLIVTIDPARRLAGAMGVPIGDEVTRVTLPATGGRLFALMPDPRRSLRTLIEHLFEGEPAGLASVLDNGIYRGFADAAAGVHELVAMNLVAEAAQRGGFDRVVIDTAPSRHAIDFVTYPGRLAALLGGRPVAWLASLARRREPAGAPGGEPTGWLAEGAGLVARGVAAVTGPVLALETARLFRDLSCVRERFVDLAQRASGLLLGPRTGYLMVAAPTGASRDDLHFLARRLEKLGQRPRCIAMNRAGADVAPYVDVLRRAGALPAGLAAALDALEAERAHRSAAVDRLAADLARHLAGVPQVRLTHVEAAAPEAVVLALAEAVGELLELG